ncbi:DUF4383 domain-containing protein [Hoyosella rhizosphaerae]|uniref:Membrane protein n=1 Tax=Hoyosella rhizosphaerae TaxID=1755582 RepID=A0A916X9U9_9ACTN|nr:DUF4383 domain-containing protein [Hoyosella rhizosphaerae]MBN4926919.1 DUF4383 domain-containing protein [Hoyosella rhizosphaerae]GGC55484.1 membrane protein [Hoyosella rhizosphaerae]
MTASPQFRSNLSSQRVRKVFAFSVGLAFLAIGVLGFIPGATTGTDELSWAGPHTDTYLFGIFAVSILHNLVHLGFGILGLIMALRPIGARIYLIGGGLGYIAITIYGLMIDHGSDLNFLPVNDADNWLHLGVGLGMVFLGIVPLRTPNKG